MQVENRLLKDKVIQLKSTITVLKEGAKPERGPQSKQAPSGPEEKPVKRESSKGRK
jgi:hypothetical protein